MLKSNQNADNDFDSANRNYDSANRNLKRALAAFSEHWQSPDKEPMTPAEKTAYHINISYWKREVETAEAALGKAMTLDGYLEWLSGNGMKLD